MQSVNEGGDNSPSHPNDEGQQSIPRPGSGHHLHIFTERLDTVGVALEI